MNNIALRPQINGLDNVNVGERNQTKGIVNSTINLFNNSFDYLPANKEDNIIVASGIEKIPAIKHEKKQNLCCTTVFSNHQWVPQIKDLILTEKNPDGADVIVLPHHIITDKIRKIFHGSNTRLILTTGVPHAMTKNTVNELYQEVKPNYFLNTSPKDFVLTVLGGDAVDTNGDILFYTKDEAEKLANFVADFIKNQPNLYLIILNGPRTGQYIHTNKTKLTKQEIEIANDSHQEIKDIVAHKSDGVDDEVSKAFINQLDKNGIDKSKYCFLNFNSNDKSEIKLSNSALVYGYLNNVADKVVSFPAGESTSVITEQLSILIKAKIIPFEHNAMNSGHHAFLQGLEQSRGTVILRKESYENNFLYKLQQSKNPLASSNSSIDTTELVAEAIKDRYKIKPQYLDSQYWKTNYLSSEDIDLKDA